MNNGELEQELFALWEKIGELEKRCELLEAAIKKAEGK